MSSRKCAGEALAQVGYVIRSGVMIFLQRHRNVGVARAK